MRIVFAGTPAFAAAALDALAEAGFDIPLVLSQPDRPSGRGMRLTPSAVKAAALARGIPVITPATLSLRRDPATAESARAALREATPDLLVVAAYGLILPADVLAIPAGIGPGITAINIHASLLPRWRGAAPIARAIAAGDERAGVTLMQMDAGLDTGPMLAAQSVPITDRDSCAALTATLATLGARMLVEALRDPDRLAPVPQPADGATYAAKIDKSESPIDWTRPAREVASRIRAFDPFPGSSTALRGTTLKVWAARAIDRQGAPGTVLSAGKAGIAVACEQGAALLTELQRPGGKRLAAHQFLQGFPIQPGEVLS